LVLLLANNKLTDRLTGLRMRRFNRDFRTPFKHILQCHVRDINSRLRSENYAEQFGGGAAAAAAAAGGFSATPRLHGTAPGAESIAVHHRTSSAAAAAPVSIATHQAHVDHVTSEGPS